MISKLWLVFASCVLLALPSCSSLDPAFLTALNSSWEKIKPYAERGVREDQTLDAAQKDVRLQLIQEFDETLEEAADAD